MADKCESKNYVADKTRIFMSSAAMPALGNIIRAATYAQRCCMQHIWSHMRRDFIDCAAGQVRLTRWCRRWIGRIASIYRLNKARLGRYDAGLKRQTAAFDAAQAALEAALARISQTRVFRDGRICYNPLIDK